MAGQLSLHDFFDIERTQYGGGRAYGWRDWDARPKLILSVLAMALDRKSVV